MLNRIYLDHAATTPCDEEAWREMSIYFLEAFGNPNSMHTAGRRARAAVLNARESIAAQFACNSNEIAFTASGTESNNLAIGGVARARRKRGKHIVTTAIEHLSTLRTCAQLESDGFSVTYLRPDGFGRVTPEQFVEALTPDTTLVTFAHANNEIGTIQRVAEIAAGVKAANPDVLIHSDAVQTAGHVAIDITKLGIDLMSFTAHKFYGPKGIAGLVVRHDVEIQPLLYGGGDERALRVGTEGVPLIVGMAVALQRSCAAIDARDAEWTAIRDYVTNRLLTLVEGTLLNGHPFDRLSTNVNVSFAGVNGEDLVLLMDREGFCMSTGSACTTGKVDPSHVLLGIGKSRRDALGAVRITFGEACRGVDADLIVSVMRELVAQQRSIAPPRLWRSRRALPSATPAEVAI
jgi:cysteine desulfurase